MAKMARPVASFGMPQSRFGRDLEVAPAGASAAKYHLRVSQGRYMREDEPLQVNARGAPVSVSVVRAGGRRTSILASCVLASDAEGEMVEGDVVDVVDQWDRRKHAVAARLRITGVLPRAPRELRLAQDAMADAVREVEARYDALAQQDFAHEAARGKFLPEYVSATGGMPAWGFFRYGHDIDPMPEAFLEALVEAALFYADNSPYATKDQFYAGLAANAPDAVEIACNAVMMTAITCDYVSDVTLRGNLCERMMVPFGWRLGAGDCEDLAKEIQLTMLAVAKIRSARSHAMGTWLAQYEEGMVTGMVTTPSMDPNSTKANDIVHVWAVLYNDDQVLNLEGTNSTTAFQRGLLDTYGPDEARRRARAQDARADLVRELGPATRGLTRMIPAKPTLARATSPAAASDFYRSALSIWTKDGEFHLVDSRGRIGVRFDEFLRNEFDMVLTWRPTPQQLAHMDYMLSLEHPLVDWPTAPPREVEATPEYEDLVRGAVPLDRDAKSLTLFAKDMDRVTPEMVSELAQYRYSVRYFPLTPTMGPIMIKVYL